MRALRLSLVPGAVALGLFAEWAALRRGTFEASASRADVLLAVADLVVGLVFVGGGVAAWCHQPESRTGLLLTGAGFAWFLGTFSASGWTGYAAFGSYFLTLHRGLFAHALLTYPAGRAKGVRDIAAVVVAYGVSAVADVGRTPEAALILGVVVAVVTGLRFVETTGPERRARLTAAVGSAAFAAALATSAVTRLDGSTISVDRGVLWSYDIVVGAVAFALALDLVLGRWALATLTGLVVDLGEPARSGALRDHLASALGDRSLELGYRLPESDGFVDEAGRRILFAERTNRRVRILRSGSDDEIAALVHDADVVADDELVDSVAAAARIAVSNARLQAEVRQRVDELEVSRRRLLEAADAQRRRLERELHEGAERRLAEIEKLLLTAAEAANGSLAATVSEARAKLERTRSELREFARGVHPRLLAEGGLAAALRDLGEGSSVPVELAVADERFTPSIETAAYFVCSEALANAAKHAEATRVRVEVSREASAIVIAITDDGRGGARLDRGSGLRGLEDRVAALGGRLTVKSREGAGTTVIAELPAG